MGLLWLKRKATKRQHTTKSRNYFEKLYGATWHDWEWVEPHLLKSKEFQSVAASVAMLVCQNVIHYMKLHGYYFYNFKHLMKFHKIHHINVLLWCTIKNCRSGGGFFFAHRISSTLSSALNLTHINHLNDIFWYLRAHLAFTSKQWIECKSKRQEEIGSERERKKVKIERDDAIVSHYRAHKTQINL